MQVNDIINSLNVISEKLFKAVEGEVYTVLDKIVNISGDIMNEEPLKYIIKENGINGIIMIANSFILFYCIYFIIQHFISMYNGSKPENIYFFVTKTVIVFIFVNNSYFIVSTILEIFSALSSAIDILARDLVGKEVTFQNLKETILSIQDFMKNDLLSLNGLIKGVISFGVINILISFSIRYVTVIFLIIISPLAIMCMSSNLTIGIFKTWFKLFITNMLIQSITKIILMVPIMFKETGVVMFKIILVGSIYILYKMMTFAKELFAKISEDRGHNG